MVKVGIIGLGLAAKRHAMALHALRDRAAVTAAWSPTVARREAFAAAHGMPVVDDLAAILDDPTIGLVLVLTPPWTHLDLARQCARAGKAILIEKPVDATLERATELVALCGKAGVRLGVCFQNRFRDAYRRLEGLVDEGRLGTLIGASAQVPWWRSSAYYGEPGRGMRAHDGGGVLINQAIHTLDQLVRLAGLPDAVSAFAATSPLRHIDSEDVAVACLRWRDGALGTVQATTAAFPGAPERIELMGTAGRAVLERGRLAVHFQSGEVIDSSEAEVPPAEDIVPHVRLIADMLDAIATGRDPAISGAGALAAQALVDAMLRASKSGVIENITCNRGHAILNTP